MSLTTALTRRLEISLPILQAPMAGGGDTPALVAAVSEAGGMGFIGAAYLTPKEITDAARAVRKLTSKPFGINLFAPQPPVAAPPQRDRALMRIAPYYAELGLDTPHLPSAPAETFNQQLAAVLESGATAFSYTFGTLPPGSVQTIRDYGLFVIGTATTVTEAVALELEGAEAIVAQGAEAGGHRGSFLGDFAANMIGTMALVPQIVDAVKLPVIASGGIMDGRGIVAAVALGAGAVQMGTAFLACDEAGVVELYKQALLSAREDSTRVTRAFSGRPARGIINRFMTEMDAGGDETILPFPLQNSLTRPLRNAAAKQGRTEFLSLWCGQGARLARRQPARALVTRLAAEIDQAVAKLSAP